MSKSTKKVMVINWGWDDDLGYSTYNPKHEIDKQAFFSPNLKFIECASHETIISKNGEYKIKDDWTVENFVVPSKINNSQFESSTKDNRYFEEVIKALRLKFKTANKVNVLFLLHKGDGFDEKSITSNKLFEVNNYFTNFGELKVDFFGGGVGILYSDNGFLSISASCFDFENPKVGWFDGEFNVEFLNLHNFDHVWDHFWYKTRELLEKLKALIRKTQLPNQSKAEKDEIRAFAGNLLYCLATEKEPFFAYKDAHMNGRNFLSCNDLEKWLGKENRAFTLRDDWIKEMTAFVNGELENFDVLNEALDNLTVSFSD